MQQAGEAVMTAQVLIVLAASMMLGCDESKCEGVLDQDGGNWHGEKAG